MPIWTNPDGLRVRFGLDQAALAREGSPAQSGAFKVYEFDIVGTEVGLTFGIMNKTPSVILPAGAIVKSAIMTVTTAFTGATATLDIGTAKVDGTVIDEDGFIAAATVASMATVGATITGAGALINTALTFDSVLVVDYDTAAFTAGRGKLVVTILIPDA